MMSKWRMDGFRPDGSIWYSGHAMANSGQCLTAIITRRNPLKIGLKEVLGGLFGRGRERRQSSLPIYLTGVIRSVMKYCDLSCHSRSGSCIVRTVSDERHGWIFPCLNDAGAGLCIEGIGTVDRELVTHLCDRCVKSIVPFDAHVSLMIEMMDGKGSQQRYCSECCQDPSLAVMLAHVMNEPVRRISVRKVWA
jgi:hypothetical protein